MFDTREEAAMRLDGTIIQGPNGPVYVKEMETSSIIHYKELSKRGGVQTTIRTATLDDGFCIKPFPLGYVNRGETCYYLQRMPVRKYKQGLHDAAMRIVLNGATRQSSRIRASALYEGPGFYAMYHNNYPSLRDVRILLEEGDCRTQAFGREWALGLLDGKQHSLYYKGNEVGVYVKDSGSFSLHDERKYLQEALMEVLI